MPIAILRASNREDYAMTVKIEKASILLCAFASAMAASAASYEFTIGTDIPLDTSYVTLHNCNIEGDGKSIGSTRGDSTMSMALSNASAGDYVLYMKGGAKSLTAMYSVSVSNEAGYTNKMTVAQADTGNWTPVQIALMELRDLPVGELTLSFEILSTTGSYAGNYGYFKICRPGDIALDVSAEGSFSAVPNAHYVSHVGCSANDTEFYSTRDGHSFSFMIYCPVRASYGFSYMSGAKESYGTNALAWVVKDVSGNTIANLGSDSIGGDVYVYSSVAALTVSHSHEFGILDAGFYYVECAISKVEAGSENYCGNFGSFVFQRQDGVPYVIANGERIVYVGQNLADSATLEDSRYGIFIESGGKLVVDLRTMGLPSCDGTRMGDGTLELPAVTFGEGANITNSVSIMKPTGYKPVYFAMYDGHGVITLERGGSSGLVIVFR